MKRLVNRCRLSVMLCLPLLVSSCAYFHAPDNPQLPAVTPGEGYRYRGLQPEKNATNLFVILAFSGGGTRAAAFSYGALEYLRDTTITINGQRRRILDEVDVISSVSGGSFPAAYYALYGDRVFADFRKRFLYRNVQAGLVLRVLAPWNWPRLMSPYYDRIDLAADYYDRGVFDGKTFGDLSRRARLPFLVLNATDMMLGSRFEFTQDQFDLLYSDLGPVAVSRAVAASSAFPILLSPIRMRNYSAPPLRSVKPQWVEPALEAGDRGSRQFWAARTIAEYTDRKDRPYIHLLDGGLSDNLGLRGPLAAVDTLGAPWSVLRMMNRRQVDTVLIISVDAKPRSHSNINARERSPGMKGMFSAVSSAPMENYSFETVQALHRSLDDFRKDQDVDAAISSTSTGGLHRVAFYDVHISFDEVTDPTDRVALEQLPTSFHLSPQQVDRLRATATHLLSHSQTLQDFVAKHTAPSP